MHVDLGQSGLSHFISFFGFLFCVKEPFYVMFHPAVEQSGFLRYENHATSSLVL